MKRMIAVAVLTVCGMLFGREVPKCEILDGGGFFVGCN